MFNARLAEPEDLELALAQGGTGSGWGRDLLQTWHRSMIAVPWVVVKGEQRVAFAWVREINYDEGQLLMPLIHPAYWWDEISPVLMAALARWARKQHFLRLRTPVRPRDQAWREVLTQNTYSPVAYFQTWQGASLQFDRQQPPEDRFSAVGARAQSGGLSYVQGIWRRWQMTDIAVAQSENRLLNLRQGVYMPWWLESQARVLTSSWAQFGADPTWLEPVLYQSLRQLQALAYQIGAEGVQLVLPAGLGNEGQLPDSSPIDEVTIWQYEVS